MRLSVYWVFFARDSNAFSSSDLFLHRWLFFRVFLQVSGCLIACGCLIARGAVFARGGLLARGELGGGRGWFRVREPGAQSGFFQRLGLACALSVLFLSSVGCIGIARADASAKVASQDSRSALSNQQSTANAAFKSNGPSGRASRTPISREAANFLISEPIAFADSDLDELSETGNRANERQFISTRPGSYRLSERHGNNQITLQNLIRSARANYPSIRSAQAAVEVSGYEIDIARWQFYPTPFVEFEGAYADESDRSYQGDTKTTKLGVTHTLWTGGKRRAGVDKSLASSDEAIASLRSAEQSLALRVIGYYANWYGAYLQGAALEKSRVTHQTLKDQVEYRANQGVATGSDLALAEGRLGSVVAKIVANDASKNAALILLREVTGLPLNEEGLSNGLNFRPLKRLDDTAYFLQKAETASPEIAAALARLAWAKADKQEQKAGLIPDLYLRLERQIGSYQYLNSDGDTRVSIGFRSQFSPGFSNRTALRASSQKTFAAEMMLAAERRALSEKIHSDLTLALAYQKQLEGLRFSLATSEEVAASYGEQFLVGRKSWLVVMNTVREIQQLEGEINSSLAAQVRLHESLRILIGKMPEQPTDKSER